MEKPTTKHESMIISWMVLKVEVVITVVLYSSLKVSFNPILIQAQPNVASVENQPRKARKLEF
jgi:hypothetical protein